MSHELIYTSVPKGLKPGSRGFSTVAMTSGLSSSWVDRLESLSGYQPIYPLGDASADRNPVSFCHWRVTVAGKARSVLSRVAFAGADYSQRSNKFAHHILLDPTEQAAGGPAWMMHQRNMMRSNWTGEAQLIPAGPALPTGDRPFAICSAWAAAAGDAGWAGVLAESYINSPSKPAYLIFEPGTDVLTLFEEALSLLSPKQRWEISFNTYFTELPLNLTCSWRAVAAGTPAANAAAKSAANAVLIDLTGTLSAAKLTGELVAVAREGKRVADVNGAEPFSESKSPAAPRKLAARAGAVSPSIELQEPSIGSEGLRTRRRLGGGTLVEEPPDADWPPEPQRQRIYAAVPSARRSPWPIIVAFAALICVAIAAGFLAYKFGKSAGEIEGRIESAASDQQLNLTNAKLNQQLEDDKKGAENSQKTISTLHDSIRQRDSKLTSNGNELGELNEKIAMLGKQIEELNRKLGTQHDSAAAQGSQNDSINAAATAPSSDGNAISDVIDPSALQVQVSPSGTDSNAQVSAHPTDVTAVVSLNWPNSTPTYKDGNSTFGYSPDSHGTGLIIHSIEEAQSGIVPVGGPPKHPMASLSVTAGQLSFSREPVGTTEGAWNDCRDLMKYSVLTVNTKAGTTKLGFRTEPIPASYDDESMFPFFGEVGVTPVVDAPWKIEGSVSGGWTLSYADTNFKFHLELVASNERSSIRFSGLKDAQNDTNELDLLQSTQPQEKFKQFSISAIKGLNQKDYDAIDRLDNRLKKYWQEKTAKTPTTDPSSIAKECDNELGQPIQKIGKRLKEALDAANKGVIVSLKLANGKVLQFIFK